MGKGSIISHDGDGLYTVTIRYDTSGISTALSVLEGIIAELETIISNPESTDTEILFAKARKLSAQKRIYYLGSKAPSDETVSAWCADLTEDLSDDVGTIEIIRNRQKGLLVQPGYEGNAVYDQARDGQLVPTMAMPPINNFVNLGFLPGMQKWAPGYRTGTITDIDYTADTCNVSLDSATNSQQGLDINQASSLSGVTIEYMSCNSVAFKTGDTVVIEFQNYDWDQPKVIGFKDNPQPCTGPLQFTLNGEAVTKPIDIYLFTEGGDWSGPFVTDATGFLAADDLEIPPGGGSFTELYAAVYYRNQDGLDNYDEMLFDFWREDIDATEFNFFVTEDTETSGNGAGSTDATITSLVLNATPLSNEPGGARLNRIDKKWSDAKIKDYPESEVDGQTVYNVDISGLKVVKIDRYRYPIGIINDYIKNCNPGNQPVDTVSITRPEEPADILPTDNYEEGSGLDTRLHSVPSLIGYPNCLYVFTDGFGGEYYYECDIAWHVDDRFVEINLCSDCEYAYSEVITTGYWRRTSNPDSHKDPTEYFIFSDDRGNITAEPNKKIYIDETRYLLTQCLNEEGEPGNVMPNGLDSGDCEDWHSKCKGPDEGDFHFTGTQWDHLYAKNKTGF